MAKYNGQLIRQFDSETSGNADAIGRVEVRLTGLPTLADVFSDEALSVPLSNPLFADDTGYYEFFIADGTYDLVIGRSPNQKTIEGISIGAGGGGTGTGLEIGDNLLTNRDPGTDFLDRNGQVKAEQDYPDLAGTLGYPFIDVPEGFTPVPPYVSAAQANITSSTPFGIFAKDTSGGIYVPSNTVSGLNGGFLYSVDGGDTEAYSEGSNTGVRYMVATNSSSIIIAVGASGVVDVFDFVTKALIGSSSAGTTTHTSAYYDSVMNTFYAINASGQVYSSTNPAAGWTFERTITGVGAGTIFVRNTYGGFVVYGITDKDLYFLDDLITGTPVKVIENTTGGDLLFSNSFCDCGSGLVIHTSTSGRKVYSSDDFGETFSEITPTPSVSGLSIVGLVNIGGGAFACSDSDGEMLYSLDFGLSWLPSGANLIPDPRILYHNTQGDCVSVPANSTSRVRMNAILPSNQQFLVSRLLPPNSTDKYYVKAR